MHNIDKLIKAMSDDLPAFRRPALAARKQAAGVSPEDAAAYLYRDIRHGVFAHKGARPSQRRPLMAKTNVEEMKSLFGFLHVLYGTRWGSLLQWPENWTLQYRNSCCFRPRCAQAG